MKRAQTPNSFKSAMVPLTEYATQCSEYLAVTDAMVAAIDRDDIRTLATLTARGDRLTTALGRLGPSMLQVRRLVRTSPDAMSAGELATVEKQMRLNASYANMASQAAATMAARVRSLIQQSPAQAHRGPKGYGQIVTQNTNLNLSG